jgi:ribosome-binding protein aMBF1 (putative translation factor)
MTTRTKNQNTLVLGTWNVRCDRCGFKMKAVDVNKEWTGLYVCKDCWEAKHPSYFFKLPKTEPGIPWVRSDDAESGGTDINGNPFPAPTPYFTNFTVEIL